ncbi:MAG: cell division protein FtsZ, partial [Actinomycetota bacterium]
DRLLQVCDETTSVLEAFRMADEVLLQGVSGITDLITTPGLINLDFADVKAVMTNAGSSLMGIGNARGEDRAVNAAQNAVSSPLLESSIDGARGVLISIAGGSDLGLFEVHEAANIISKSAHPDANIIFGAVIDDQLGDEVRLTVIASGFERADLVTAQAPAPVKYAQAPPDLLTEDQFDVDDELERDTLVPGVYDSASEGEADVEEDDLDIPSFLRRS